MHACRPSCPATLSRLQTVHAVLANLLLAVTASVYQMMRGAEMLFAALFAVIFLRRSLNRWHYGGIGCCVLGIALVGVSSMLSGELGSWMGCRAGMHQGACAQQAHRLHAAVESSLGDPFCACRASQT